MRVQEKKQPQEWLNNLYIPIVVFWVAFFDEESQGTNYQPIVRSLLPEVLRQQKLSKTDMEFVLDSWNKSDSDDYLKAISRLLKSGIYWYNRLWIGFMALFVILVMFSYCSNNSSNRRRNTYSSRRPAPTFTQPRGRSNNTRNNYVRPTYKSRTNTVNQRTKQEIFDKVIFDKTYRAGNFKIKLGSDAQNGKTYYGCDATNNCIFLKHGKQDLRKRKITWKNGQYTYSVFWDEGGNSMYLNVFEGNRPLLKELMRPLS
ncbi:hypothetical protein [Okeania sp. SIO2B3]|uniref:hypothetical protein n=1 Tax=Okeania sp. SIO2B3 TaxID=2607784 RepID=UPI0013C196AF|nr:hypothetical protein [Okeania sp. SIO2B3]NET43596.1 hypothetical protein [Okeania sp. SIO2B3]